MVVKDGHKYACDQCIRGHRVSGCNHHDRELHFINPKGRPVKQCDHCRGARKSKSHHARCNCGGKDKGELKLDDKECCCMLGDNCVCGATKSPDELTADGASSKASHARPHLPKNSSDGHLTTYINGRHKACHKWDAAPGHGVPYPTRRVSHGHGQSGHSRETSHNLPQTQPMGIPQGSSRDDSALFSGAASLYSDPAQLSVDNLSLSSFAPGSFGGSSDIASAPQPTLNYVPVEAQGQQPFSPEDSVSEDYLNALLASSSNPSPPTELLQVRETPTIFRTSPDDFVNLEQSSFGSHDLPLNSNNLSVTFPQPKSFSGDSNAHSAPGLTAASSTTHSELGDASMSREAAGMSFDASSLFSAPFDFQNMSMYDPTGPQHGASRPPTSDPSSDSARRSFDVSAMRNLSTFPTFGDALESYVGIRQYDNGVDGAKAQPGNAAPQVARASLPYGTASGAAASTSNLLAPSASSFNPSTASALAPERPRSATVPSSTYNPTSLVDAMYPQLDQEFANAAASWNPPVAAEFASFDADAWGPSIQ